MKLWLNGSQLHQTEKKVPLRPNLLGDDSNYTEKKFEFTNPVVLQKGWNQVLIKLERNEEPIKAHFTAARPDPQHPINNGIALTKVKRSQFTWEEQ
ncbi:hypothetical protein AKJ57_05315 [candidate division MSBL1 archaeon SCGC-AAA259A05]|uniref:Uncharacterized protein n=1 Tax=candidate division MSBL1 archaeon SCGC-AAA259A05 TaxID=1698259 RepID=A0A133U5H3_9EURY|nr:hypothetical protein AKJ57_05315 [candidate division MSBL1 archaeon SCGC-AAA259A05]